MSESDREKARRERQAREDERDFRGYDRPTVKRALRADEAKHVEECTSFGCPLCIELANRGAA